MRMVPLAVSLPLCAAIVLVGAVDAGADSAPFVTPADFQRWFASSCEGRLRIPERVKRAARRYRYVFVGGFLNERMPGYFSQNARELRARGVPSPAIHFVSPSSHKSFEENREAVGEDFRRIAGAGPERLVVIAHSRGACDALAFALQDAQFVADRVEALFLVQGPFGGTGVADYVMGEGVPLDRQMPVGSRVVVHLLGKFGRWVMDGGSHAGMAKLTRSASRRFWEETLERHADAIPIVGPRTFFVTAEVCPSRLRLVSRAFARYLLAYYGPNDGLVVLEDQSLPGLGTDLGPLVAGHADLTRTFFSTRAKRRVRKALVHSILMAVGQADPIPEPEPERPRRQWRGRARRGEVAGMSAF